MYYTTESEAGPSGSDSSSPVVSLLNRLKSPIPAEIARKRKLKTTPPSVGKRQCKGTVATDPKSVEPRKGVREFPYEMLKK